MSLQQRTLDTSSRLAVPYEIFLDIIDAFINDVFATNIKPPEEGVNLAFLYEHKVTSKLAFVVATGNESSSWMSKILKDRFRSVRVALHLDRESRAKVHRKFPPAAILIHKDDRRWSVNALTLPEIDSFSMLYFPDRRDAKARLLEHRLLQLVRLPSAETYACLQGIQCVYFPNVLCFDVDLNDTGVAVAMALPNLKSITVVVGATTDEGMKDKTYHLYRQPIDGVVFPDLQKWSNKTSHITELWPPFRDRGVKLYGVLAAIHIPVMEIFVTDEGVSVEYLMSNCSCCEHLER